MAEVTAKQGKRRTQEERSRIARRKLIDSAVTLICQQGFASTTTQQIASHAGLTRGAIQHHFSGRAELYAEVVRQVELIWQQSFVDVSVDKNASVKDRINRLMDNLWKVVCTPLYRAAVDICFNSRNDPELRAVVQEAINSSTQHFTQCWYDTFTPEINKAKVRETCALVSAITQGLVISGVYTEKPDTIPRSAKKTLHSAKSLVADFMLSDGGPDNSSTHQ